MVQLSQLRAFHEVVRAGSLAGAATQLSLTASAVSQQVSALERVLGVQLFERRARAIRPTPAAAALVLRADDILAQVAVLERDARALASGARGVVRIGSFPTASARLLPGAIARLAARRSGVEVLLDEDEPEELLRRLESRSLDLAVVYHYDVLPSTWPTGIEKVPLLRESLILLTAAIGPDPSPSLTDAHELPWVGSREQTAGARALSALCGEAGFTPRVRYRSNDYDVVRGLVAAGLGAAVIPALAHVPDPGNHAVPVARTDATRTVFVTHREGDPNPMIPIVLRALRQASRALRSELLTAL